MAAGPGGPRPAPPASQTDSNREKKDLASWWKNFKRGDKKAIPEPGKSLRMCGSARVVVAE